MASTFWSSVVGCRLSVAFYSQFLVTHSVQPISCQAEAEAAAAAKPAQNDNPGVIKNFYFILTFSVIVKPAEKSGDKVHMKC